MNQRLVIVSAAVVAAAGFALARAHSGAPAGPSSVALAPTPSGASERPAAERSAPARAVVYVAGAVARPGVYELPAGARVVAALHAAGGLKGDADPAAVNLAERVSDGEEVLVPRIGSSDDQSAASLGAASSAHHHKHRKHRRRRRRAPFSTAADGSATTASAHQPDAAPAAPVDLNTAEASQLSDVPGLGPSIAARIVAFRERNGPFASVDDLLDVGGVTQRRLDEAFPYLRATR